MGQIFTRAELTAARRWRERERRRSNESKREEKRDRRGCMEIDKTDMRDAQEIEREKDSACVCW